MARFVHDTKTNRWVIIAPGRVKRPHDNPSVPDNQTGNQTMMRRRADDGQEISASASGLSDKSSGSSKLCPFCPGQEELNKELFSVGDPWQVRVITNKYPLTDIHEVIIHSPDHNKDIDELPLSQVELILQTYRARYNYNKQFGTVLVFNNHDIHAGASLGHPHSQLVVVPREISLETLPKEPVENVVAQTTRFTAYCPNFSQWPYEIWVSPNMRMDANQEQINANNFNFGQITDEQIADLAALLQKILKVVVGKFKGETDIPYNFYIYHGLDWYLRIIPRLIHRAGLELGTGLSVNIVDPKQAAEEYKAAI
ncbi:MAG: DUF4931 domain-containing protein [Patescibacteria group bacterium]|nr:DUF4931 domain-containing protein [Patescibacteria group bacterium]MCL5432281.1 DUF4931 domain-containing protein [Patescibacteria group bacterium]